jgi:multidrug efflux system membrane fusion protein
MALGATLLSLLPGCRPEAPAEAPPLPVTITKVAGASDAGGPRYSASLVPDVQVDVAFKVNGYVEEILQVRGADGRLRNLQDGDYVARGTVLARVRTREYLDAQTQAAAGLTRSKADFGRIAQLYENRSVSKADYDAAYARFQADQAEHDRATQALNDCALVAPLDGYVLGRSVEIGSLVAPGAPAFSIGNLRSVKVVFGVPDVVVATLRPGVAQRVTVEAVPGRNFQGRYTRISPSADASSRMFQAEVTIPNPQGELKPGMIAALELTTGQAAAPKPAMLIPLNAVIRPPGSDTGYAVFVVEAQGATELARLRSIEPGDISGNLIQVRRGLQGGERVIVRGATLAVDSRPVRIIP